MNVSGSGNTSETIVRVSSDADRVVLMPSDGFVSTPYVETIAERALTYLKVGYPVHFAGPAGTGKTTLAFHVAAKLGRPVMLVHGDDELGSSDLVGKDAGLHRSTLVDNFVHSVLKTEEKTKTLWVDNRLTEACQKGYTLIYDEFNRSRPQANNVLLSVLSEKLLNLPRLRASGKGYLKVHPEFRAICTSNPEEYAGTYRAQDALMDRLITMHLGHFDRESEIDITVARSGIKRSDAEVIVDAVRALRNSGGNSHRPTVRACIMIARILVHLGIGAQWDNCSFAAVCRDVLGTEMASIPGNDRSATSDKVDEILQMA